MDLPRMQRWEKRRNIEQIAGASTIHLQWHEKVKADRQRKEEERAAKVVQEDENRLREKEVNG